MMDRHSANLDPVAKSNSVYASATGSGACGSGWHFKDLCDKIQYWYSLNGTMS